MTDARFESLAKHGSWPLAGLVIVLVAMFIFRSPIQRLIDRIRKLSKTGIDAGGTPQDQIAHTGPDNARDVMRTFDNALLVQRENEIRKTIEEKFPPAGPEREKAFIRVYAAVIIGDAFERANAAIWGSQIVLLQMANSAPPEGVALDAVRPIFDFAVERDPERFKNDRFERWLSFLVSLSFVEQRGEHVFITLEGREFLKYLVDKGYPVARPG
jgi:hypothetical protein